MIRPVLSLERLAFLEGESQVGYRWGRQAAEQEAMDYLEFTARVTSHIPDKGQVMVRYYGLYANAHFIRHLQLTFAAERPPPHHVLCKIVLMAAEEGGEYE
ncbi:MAG: putative transposase [candidate division NC10 bacterium]|jgi:hypothetical protein|nr:putative transposase [candidate division NC10 bacterium]